MYWRSLVMKDKFVLKTFKIQMAKGREYLGLNFRCGKVLFSVSFFV